MILENEIYSHVPLDYKSTSDRINSRHDRPLLKFLLEHYWVADDTDLNDDLGFVFLLRARSEVHIKADCFYKLYLSCVLSVATLKKYTFNSGDGFWVEEKIDDIGEFSTDLIVKQIMEKLDFFGYTYLNSNEIQSDVSDLIKNKLGSFEGGYFNLLFSEL